MARGINETDVWQASDVLLLEGQRPTIERVRQKIGRGSPNTVSPYLDTWFRHLGGRIKDPGAFSAPPALPDPVQQAAQHFWDIAFAQTRLDFDERLKEGMAAAVANVEAEKARAAQAEAAAFEALARANKLQADLAERTAALESEALAHAATAAHLLDARQQVAELKLRIDTTEQEMTRLREQAQREVSGAVERAAGAERRAALEIDSERTLRAKTEKRSDALERRLELSQTELLGERSRHVETAAKIKSLQEDLARTREDVRVAQGAQADAAKRVEDATAALAESHRRAEVAEARAALSERFLAQVSIASPAEPVKPRAGKRKHAATTT